MSRHLRITAPVFLLALAALALLVQPDARPSARADSPGGWTSDVLYQDIPRPMDFAFAPDGRIFIATLTGQVRIIKNGVLLATPFHSVPANSRGERGLVGMALDTNFAANGFVYLYYTHENSPSAPQGPKMGRLIRVTAGGDVSLPGSEVVLLGSVIGDASQPSCTQYPVGTDCLPADGLSHTGGALRFGADGTLLLATGDAAQAVPNPEQLLPHVQDLDRLAGKLLRIDPATGQGLPDNPFYTGDATDNRSKVYAYGFRQPFRFGVRPGTNVAFVGEVGSNYWEEIDVVVPGGNYGWPCFEGYVQHPAQSALPVCQALIASGAPVAHPAHVYERLPPYGAAVIGGVFANGSNYPPDAAGAYFFAEYIKDEIYALRFDGANDPIDGSLQTILAGAGRPVDFETGPDGDVYYAAWDRLLGSNGEIRRLRFVEGNRDPIARAAAEPAGGLAPLSVDFSSAGSMDPDGDALSYAWDFGDGGESTEANPSHTFTQDGWHDVTLTVLDGNGGSDTTTVAVLAGNQPPQAMISLPRDPSSYEAWGLIEYAGAAYDPEIGMLGPGALAWSIGLVHCEPVLGGVCHTHPYADATGAGGSLIAPNQGGDLNYLVFELTATDSAGLSHTTAVSAGPDWDGDGLLDFQEVLTTGTDPLDPDTDGGGASDLVDTALGDPFDPSDDAGLLVMDTDGDGCTDARELGPNEGLGGRRDRLNSYDFYDTDGDGEVGLLTDVFDVIFAFGADADDAGAGEPDGYDEALDRTEAPLASEPWDTMGPNGVIDLFGDIFGVIYQYGHSCTR